MRFAHMGDCHLGGWRQPELMSLNSKSFQIAVETCIKEKLDFVLIAGDLFDSAYPPIDVIKETFSEFRKLKEANIPVFLIAGSHDYSASGKTFLDVLDKAGFCKNVFQSEEKDGKIILHPTIYKDIAIYGYPGKKSGMEVPDIGRIEIMDSPGYFKILMLHTAIRDAVGNLPIPAVDEKKLPRVNYIALAHLHIKYNKEGRIYCGPTFPNNSTELEELKGGSFYIVDTSGKAEKREIKLKDVIVLNIEIKNSLIGTDKIIDELKNHDLKDKILILKLYGTLENGKASDIQFNKIEEYARKQQSYTLLKNTSKLHVKDSEINFEVNSENLEEDIIEKFQKENSSEFNHLIKSLFLVLQAEKKEDEKSQIFEERLISEVSKVLGI